MRDKFFLADAIALEFNDNVLHNPCRAIVVEHAVEKLGCVCITSGVQVFVNGEEIASDRFIAAIWLRYNDILIEMYPGCKPGVQRHSLEYEQPDMLDRLIRYVKEALK